MTIRSKADIEADIATQTEALGVLQKERAAILAKTLVRCEKNCHGPGCGQGFEISELEYIQTHWYVEPTGCTGGDYWKEGEGNWICPKCGHRNRLYNRPEVMKLKGLFCGKVNEHEH